MMPMRAIDCAGQAVVVTGGTRGIGAGIAQAFLRAGAQVLVCGRSEPADAAALPSADGRTALFARADVRDPDQAKRLVRAAVGLFGHLDVMVSNAGGSPPAQAATASPRFHAKVIELNLIAPLHVAQAANQVMQGQPAGGSIIMIGSVSGTRPSPGTAAYGAAKAGLHHLATSLAVEWAPKVRVNSVVPGLVATQSAAAHYGDPAAPGGDPAAPGGSPAAAPPDEGSARMAAAARTVPLLRMATPDDVADACLFLASPLASYISGAALTLHGGGERPAFLAAADGSVYIPRK
jgi:NAD(P)-dependent dehydrogenase (short-subunit alcohol dehydrogenase family)